MESPVAEPHPEPAYSAPMTARPPLTLRPPPHVARARSGRTRARRERLIHAALAVCGMISIFTTAGIVAVLLFEAIAFFREVSLWRFLTDLQWTPLFADKQFGVIVLVSATFLTSASPSVLSIVAWVTLRNLPSRWRPAAARRR